MLPPSPPPQQQQPSPVTTSAGRRMDPLQPSKVSPPPASPPCFKGICRDCQGLEPFIGKQLASLLYPEPNRELTVGHAFGHRCWTSTGLHKIFWNNLILASPKTGVYAGL
uniref:Uncharacterized protein n=1 Tax=Setaria italica TaxID=4555 RepID=K3ZNK0_SETIT